MAQLVSQAENILYVKQVGRLIKTPFAKSGRPLRPLSTSDTKEKPVHAEVR